MSKLIFIVMALMMFYGCAMSEESKQYFRDLPGNVGREMQKQQQSDPSPPSQPEKPAFSMCPRCGSIGVQTIYGGYQCTNSSCRMIWK
jgi:hypothetical protein